MLFAAQSAQQQDLLTAFIPLVIAIIINGGFMALVYFTAKKRNHKPWGWVLFAMFFGFLSYFVLLWSGQGSEFSGIGSGNARCPRCNSTETQGYGINYSCMQCEHDWQIKVEDA